LLMDEPIDENKIFIHAKEIAILSRGLVND